MASSLIFMCNRGDLSAAIVLPRTATFTDLVAKLCHKWTDLSVGSLSLVYSFEGHAKCMLGGDDDLEALFAITLCRHVDIVDVNVMESTSSISCTTVDTSTSDTGSHAGLLDISPVDAEIDIPRSFCQHTPKTLKSSGWVDLITGVGQRFPHGVVAFRDALTKYSVIHAFEFYYFKNDKKRVKAFCVRKNEGEGCLWTVEAVLDKPTCGFIIKEFNGRHTCGSTVLTDKIARVGGRFIGRLITDELQTRPNKRAVDVVHDMKQDYGVEVTYRRAYTGLKKAKSSAFGSYADSFANLKWYAQKFKEVDPSSSLVVECDDLNRFVRLFVGFGACKYGFKYCRPLLFLDGTFLKSEYKGSLLSACSKDGNQGLYPISFAVVDGETYASWHWFLSQLRVFLDLDGAVVFISDRHLGLLQAVKDVFPMGHHSYCLVHMKKNLRTQLKGVSMDRRKLLVDLFGKCAHAPTVEIFKDQVAELEREGGQKVKDFLFDLDASNWAHAYFPSRRFGEMSSNLAECFNNWIKAERELPITQLVEAIRQKLMEQMACRRDESLRWKAPVCPYWDSRFKDLFQFSRTWIVRKSSSDVYEVCGNPTNTVNITERRCTCKEWQLNSFPCVHAICAIRKSGGSLNEFIEPYYLVQYFRESYSKPIVPIPTVYKSEFVNGDVILPPTQKRPAGRPKTQRISPIWKTVKKRVCSRCGNARRHNKRTCKEPVGV